MTRTMNVSIHCHVQGKAFSPSLAEKRTKLPLSEKNEVGDVGMLGDARPAEKDPHHLGAQTSRHADEFAHVGDLAFTVFRDRAAEIVVGGDAVNLDALAVSNATEFPAAAAG